MLTARFTRRKSCISDRPSGRSSVVEHDLAKVGVEGSNPFARSSFSFQRTLFFVALRRKRLRWGSNPLTSAALWSPAAPPAPVFPNRSCLLPSGAAGHCAFDEAADQGREAAVTGSVVNRILVQHFADPAVGFAEIVIGHTG